jgi:glycosyltransferase involved in cell wall biosynthesis
MDDDPFVSILTPVYNGDQYLSECIESVLAQTYSSWEYIIVNNCSTDKTLEIACNYAKKDKRIAIINNQHFVNAEDNHNIAFKLISPKSRYCKVISADDTISPECIEQLVALAKANPSIGIVGSYQYRGSEIRWKGLPPTVSVLSGRDACRLTILHNAQIFGNPTSELYNSEMIRKNQPFFPGTKPYADITACYEYLREWDFGFVHRVLSRERIHDQQESSIVREIGMDNFACIDHFIKYGPIYLTKNEYEKEQIIKLNAYHRWLGGCLLKMRSVRFWKYQYRAFKECGYPIDWHKVFVGAFNEICDEIQHPSIAFKKVLKTLGLVK